MPTMSAENVSKNEVELVVFIYDICESTLLYRTSPDATYARQQELDRLLRAEILPAHSGTPVKSSGDGMLATFARVDDALGAAFDLQGAVARLNAHSDFQMHVRVGMDRGPVRVGTYDVFGNTPNLADRLASVAGPGEIVVSSAVRNELIPALDADIEDLGEKRPAPIWSRQQEIQDLGTQYLKNIPELVRAYRVGPPGPRPVIERAAAPMKSFAPTVAVLPFEALTPDPHGLVGEVLADEVIASLSHKNDLRMISRLSTSRLKGRSENPAHLGGVLRAEFVLRGSYRVWGDSLIVTAELFDIRSDDDAPLWRERLKGTVDALLRGEGEFIQTISDGIGAAVFRQSISRSRSRALPNLSDYELLIGAINEMHRGLPDEMRSAESRLEELSNRLPRHPVPYAWRAKILVLRHQKGIGGDRRHDAEIALSFTRRAVDLDPQSSLALAVEGFVYTNLLKRLDLAGDRYEAAIQSNPNDSVALLLSGTRHAFMGSAQAAVEQTTQARSLSPLDPLMDWYDSLRATAALAAKDYDGAISLAKMALRINKMQRSALRALTIAQWLKGEEALARETAKDVLREEPGLTVRGFLDRSPSSEFETGRSWAEALRGAGVPE